MKLNDIYEFAREHTLQVIATEGEDGQPNAAVTAFALTPEWELIVGASKYSRKVANIMQNPKVAVVIGWDEDQTVQAEGEARIAEGDELEQYRAIHLDQNPSSKAFANDPKNIYIVVKLGWLRFTDISEDPEYIKEYKL